jgi:hypothetical protein
MTTAREIRDIARAITELIEAIGKLKGTNFQIAALPVSPQSAMASVKPEGEQISWWRALFNPLGEAMRVVEADKTAKDRRMTQIVAEKINSSGSSTKATNTVTIQKIEIANPNATPSDIASAINSSIQDAFSLQYSSMRGNIAPAR